MGFTSVVRAEDVNDIDSFAEFVRQTVGTPYCSGKDKAILRRMVKEFFESNPQASWQTLCKVAMWAKANKKRPQFVYSILRPILPWAWAAGALPELDPTHARDEDVEERIAQALQVETDQKWRNRLVGAQGVAAREEVLRSWTEQRSSLSPTK